MSEDKIEIPGNEEPTEGLEPSKAPTTQIMLEAVLARMNEGFAELKADIAQLNARVGGIESDLHQFRLETAKNFEIVHSKFNLINERVLEVEAVQKVTTKHIEDLERKAS
jgi:hypothetical protein